MSRNVAAMAPQPFPDCALPPGRTSLESVRNALGIRRNGRGALACELPFGPGDATVGVENELQVAVNGRAADVDLAETIRSSKYLRNILRRAERGELSRGQATDLERFLDANHEGVWENSWVRFPLQRLGTSSRALLDADLRADKRAPGAGPRSDADRFFLDHRGERWLRVPISYLLRLALAEALDASASDSLTPSVHAFGIHVMDCLLNDNTSPEVISFYPCSGTGRRAGASVARETARRFLLCHLLVELANTRFGLAEHGQRTDLYFSPQTPWRQRQLNTLVSDSFYRHLFMSPCLSGWDQGEAKQDYMRLCHEVLSRSRLQTMIRLKDCGIVANNLVVLPSVSNTSLANNGTHVSLGSRRLGAALCETGGGFGACEEKHLGDLVIKIVEHFLPLFVGTYSASPQRLDFWSFHPETALGFLPHELEPVHLRMLWRRWKGKAHLRRCGKTFTPFGPIWLDRWISRALGLHGDTVPDGRLIDYLVSPLSTEASPGLDGSRGNDLRLKQDLAELGIFDARLSLYLMMKPRAFNACGFSGFENRIFSLFPSLLEDMGPAIDLTQLLLMLAWRLVLNGDITHRHIPDTPIVESERRQVFFAAALDVPTFFVSRTTENRLIHRILERTPDTRPSHRYPGYVRVKLAAYRKALIDSLCEDGADLVEALDAAPLLEDLRNRVESGSHRSAATRLTADICKTAGVRNAFACHAESFSLAAETFYRGALKQRHLAEAWQVVREDLKQMEQQGALPPMPPDFAVADFEKPGDAESVRHAIALLLHVMAWDEQRQTGVPGWN